MSKVPVFSATVTGDYTYNIYDRYEEVTCKKPRIHVPILCYVIITCRSLAWTFLTLASTLTVVAAVITPQWLIGPPHWAGLPVDGLNVSSLDPEEDTYYATVGLFNGCTRVRQLGGIRSDSCSTYVTGFGMTSDEFPDTWKSSLILLSVGVVLLGFTSLTAILSVCVQSMCRKSLFTVSGLIQSVAALFLVVGQVIYPAGWGAQRVKNLCGEKAGPFLIEQCQIGWAYFACMGGTAMVFVCALLSIQAETATSSDKVERKIVDGKHCICVL